MSMYAMLHAIFIRCIVLVALAIKHNIMFVLATRLVGILVGRTYAQNVAIKPRMENKLVISYLNSTHASLVL